MESTNEECIVQIKGSFALTGESAILADGFRDKSHRGAASQFFVAGELCRRGTAAVVTLGNCPNTDILCSNRAGTRFAHVQVKTFRPGDRTCSVGVKAERVYGDGFFWILAGIPEPGSSAFEYFIIPSSEIAREVADSTAKWAADPGMKGQQRRLEGNGVRTVAIPPKTCYNGWSIEPFRNRWDLIINRLKDPDTQTVEL